MKYTDDNIRILFYRGDSFDQIAAIFNAANPDQPPISRSVIAGKVKRLASSAPP